MDHKQTYKDKNTGKVGEYSDAMAKLYPSLELIEAPASEPTAEQPATEPSDNGGTPAPSRKKVAD